MIRLREKSFLLRVFVFLKMIDYWVWKEEEFKFVKNDDFLVSKNDLQKLIELIGYNETHF